MSAFLYSSTWPESRLSYFIAQGASLELSRHHFYCILLVKAGQKASKIQRARNRLHLLTDGEECFYRERRIDDGHLWRLYRTVNQPYKLTYVAFRRLKHLRHGSQPLSKTNKEMLCQSVSISWKTCFLLSYYSNILDYLLF